MPDAWRAMWLMVSYDLPVGSPKERRAETQFRAFLERDGYIRLNFSVYSRFCGSVQAMQSSRDRVYRRLPDRGHVLLLEFTDAQWGRIEHIHRGDYRARNPDVESARPTQLKLF